MGLLDWLRRATQQNANPQQLPPEQYPLDEKRILLSVAAEIRAAGGPLDQLMATTSGLGAAISTLRQAYGYKAVEVNSPAERMIAGFANTGDLAEANKLYDELIADLKEFEGDDIRTHMRLAWMLNSAVLEDIYRGGGR